MVLMAITTFHEYVLQYEERLLQITLIRLSLPAANLAGIVALSPFIGEYCLPVAYLIGHVVVFVLMAIRAPYQYRPSITIRPELERRIFLNAAVVMSTGLIARARSLVMNYLASKLGSGAISALAFAGKITEPLERTAFTGLRMLMFSRASRLHAANNRAALARLYGMGLRACFMVVTPLLAWIVFNSQEIVALMFGHGQFTAEDTARVATTLSALAPVVLFVGVNALLSNAFYAMNTVKVPAIVMPLGTLIYTVCAIPLADLLGTPGIALSSTIATAILCCALLFALGRRVPELAMSRMALSFCGYLALGGAVMTVAVTGLRTLELPELAVAAISLPLGVLVYVGLLWLFRDDMLQRLTTMVRTSRTGDAAA
jgi:putative peptidoglycan lipid II flippase